jgi:DnaJ-class molecular chaperone
MTLSVSTPAVHTSDGRVIALPQLLALLVPPPSLFGVSHPPTTSVDASSFSSSSSLNIFGISRGGGNDNDNDNNNNNNNSVLSEDILQHPDDYYRILGLIDENANDSTTSSQTSLITASQITKAYRRRAVQTHPDKTGGDRQAFDLVAKAYEVLGAEDTRAVYDRYGVAGLEAGQSGGGMQHSSSSSFHDFVSQMFHASPHNQQQPRRNRTMRYQLQVTLEELYSGVTKHVVVPTTRSRRQDHSPSSKKVQVDIPRGSVVGQPIRLAGAVDDISDAPPGDLIFVLTPAPHSIFTRKNHDLAMELVISLEEAICGVRHKRIRHLDESLLEVDSAVTTTTTTSNNMDDAAPLVIATGDVQVLPGRGFPKTTSRGHHASKKDDHGHDVEYGDLYIQFRVEMPTSPSSSGSTKQHPLSVEEREDLRRLLEKLQGKRSSSSSRTSRRTKKTKSKTNKPSASTASTSRSEVEEDDDKQDDSTKAKTTRTTPPPLRLIPGRVSDFGRKTGTARVQTDDQHHHDHAAHHHDEEDHSFFGGHHPFGSGSSTFFQQGEQQGSRSFYFGGSHPFAGDDGEAGDTQCKQM